MSGLDDEKYIESWPKRCSCGETYSEEQWERLKYVGAQPAAGTGFPDLEMRNCARCKSTLAIALPNDFQ